MSRNWDDSPETEVDRRFHDLRDSGYTGPIDQDGYAAFDVTLRAERRSIVGTLIGLAVLAAAVLIAISYLSGCAVGGNANTSPPKASTWKSVPPPALPAGLVTLPQNFAGAGISGDKFYAVCAHPDQDYGAEYEVQVRSLDDADVAGGRPCPTGPVIGWDRAWVIKTVIGFDPVVGKHSVVCSGIEHGVADIQVVPDDRTAVYHIGDQCPNGKVIG